MTSSCNINDGLPHALRMLRGLDNQAEFAARVGCSRTALSLWERGETRPRNRFAKRLIEMGLDPVYVLPTAPAATDARADLSSRGAA